MNIGLRGLTLASKFVLIFFLARFIEPAELGLYGLLAATVAYSVYLLGFDFYTFTTREILKMDRSEWGRVLKGQCALSLVLYGVFLPLLALLFVFELLPWTVAFWFFVLLILEHINQEIARLLVAVSEQLTASVVLFFRSGAWAVVVTVWMFADAGSRNLDYVLGAWTAGGIIGVLIGGYKLSRMKMSGWRSKVDWQWARKGLRVAVPLLVGTLALRAIFTLDRYWFELLMNRELLGAYVLFMGLVTALMSFLDAGVFAFKYPGLIAAFNRHDDAAFRHGMRTLLVQTVVLSVSFAVCAIVVIHPLLTWIDKPLYIVHQPIFYWLLGVTFLYAIGMVPHYGLYAQGHDRPIIRSHIAGVGIFVLTAWAIGMFSPYLAVPLGLIAAFFAILVWKSTAYYRVTAPSFRSLYGNTLFKTKQETD